MQEHPEPGSSPKGLWWKALLAAWFGLSGIGAVAAVVGARLPEELDFPVLAVAWVLVWMIWRRRVAADDRARVNNVTTAPSQDRDLPLRLSRWRGTADLRLFARSRGWRRSALCVALVMSGLGACSNDEPSSSDRARSSRPAESDALSFESRDPAVIVNALTTAGVQICDELLLPIPNRSYRFEDTRELTITVADRACHTSIRDMEAEPSHGFLSLERFTAASERDTGLPSIVKSSSPARPQGTTTQPR